MFGCGRICIGRRKINLSTIFAGQTVGIREVADKIWLVSFMQYDIGFFDEEAGRVEPAENPFILKKCSPCLRYKTYTMSPVRTQDHMELAIGFEPTTC